MFNLLCRLHHWHIFSCLHKSYFASQSPIRKRWTKPFATTAPWFISHFHFILSVILKSSYFLGWRFYLYLSFLSWTALSRHWNVEKASLFPQLLSGCSFLIHNPPRVPTLCVVGAHPCMLVWRPEVSVGCLPLLPSIFFDKESLIEPGLIQPGWLTSKFLGSTYLTPWCQNSRHAPPHPTFMWVFEIRSQVPRVCRLHWDMLPAPQLISLEITPLSRHTTGTKCAGQITAGAILFYGCPFTLATALLFRDCIFGSRPTHFSASPI